MKTRKSRYVTVAKIAYRLTKQALPTFTFTNTQTLTFTPTHTPTDTPTSPLGVGLCVAPCKGSSPPSFSTVGLQFVRNI
jgi:hypothetical protein